MTHAMDRPRGPELREILRSAISVQWGSVDIESAASRYRAEGHGVTPWLEQFLVNYGEVVVEWRVQPWAAVTLTTRVEDALEEPLHNVRYYNRRIGKRVLPVGAAYDTGDCILLAEDGEILIGSGAGVQRIGVGFENTLRALLGGNWDKTFYWNPDIPSSYPEI